ncbi:MAG: kinase, partial [Longimicrobiales bacterium]
SSGQIDEWYSAAMAAGAEGGKLCGAGGGGFLMFIVRPERQAAVCGTLANLMGMRVGYEAHGSHIVPLHD